MYNGQYQAIYSIKSPLLNLTFFCIIIAFSPCLVELKLQSSTDSRPHLYGRSSARFRLDFYCRDPEVCVSKQKFANAVSLQLTSFMENYILSFVRSTSCEFSILLVINIRTSSESCICFIDE